mgnify:CR=1 FL=1
MRRHVFSAGSGKTRGGELADKKKTEWSLLIDNLHFDGFSMVSC